MLDRLKRTVLYLSKWSGLFGLAHYFTRDGLRILCYHGFALEDESSFRAKLFMRPDTFRKRLQFLSDHRYPVLGVELALDLLGQRKLPPNATVITIDDGWFGTYRYAKDLLQSFRFPATLYVVSYYCVHRNPVFRMCVQYMFWKTTRREMDVDVLGIARSGQASLADRAEKDRVMWEIIRHGEEDCDETERAGLAETLGQRLGVDYRHIARERLLCLVSPEEIREMASSGIDIQLHTHRHRFPEDESSATREIADNRATLEPLLGRRAEHFCYPSGLWSRTQWPWLKAAGIKSATICEPGFNYPDTPAFALRRFLDGEDISQIEFEAEMCGFSELARRMRSAAKRLFRLPETSHAQPPCL